MRETYSSIMRNSQIRTACDRCYKLKERCERAATSNCRRCERLGRICSTVRPVLPVGRRRHREKKHDPVAIMTKTRKTQVLELVTSPCLIIESEQQMKEQKLYTSLLSQPDFLDPFVVCSKFQRELQDSLTTTLPTALPMLKDAYIACAISLTHLGSGPTTKEDTSACILYISKAMSVLRSLHVSNSQEMALCNILGSLLAFSIYSAIGIGATEICSFCLSTANPLMETTIFNGPEDPWQNFLILLETMDCLVHRRKPTRKIQCSLAIDRQVGLCSSLLSYYYDLCIISSSLVNTTDLTILARLQTRLDGIHAAVESWQPSNADQLVEQFNPADLVNLLAQAKVYRLGALLVGHRLQNPFGFEDAQAEIWSKEAIMELELAKRVTKRPLRFVTLPFIVAAVEVRDENLRFRTIECVDDYVDGFAPFMRQATKMFLSRVWQERDMRVTTCWFDSIHKPCPVMDSIDATCFGSS